MQGTVAQVIVLTTYGNAVLGGAPAAVGADLLRAHGAFRFCAAVRFVDTTSASEKPEDTGWSRDPAEWFARLGTEGVVGLRLVYGAPDGSESLDHRPPDHLLAGFVGGGGRWLIEARKPAGSDFWEGQWDVDDRERPDRRIWRVVYARILRDQPVVSRPTIDLQTLRTRLTSNLQALSRFARRHELDNFAESFESGLEQLRSASSGQELTPADLAPAGVLPVASGQLLAVAQSVSVFGGMGSWNDLGFEGEDQALYERLSGELHGLLNAAIVMAVNAGVVGSGPEGLL